jgi:hypothetical protein
MERTGRGITAGRLIVTLALTLSGVRVWLASTAAAKGASTPREVGARATSASLLARPGSPRTHA